MQCANIHRLIKKTDLNNSVRVMYSHEVKRDDFHNFETVIKYLNQISSILNPKEFFYYLESNKYFTGKNVMFTFDDGLLSSYHFAKEILNKYNIKAIFFVPTAILKLSSKNEMRHFVKNNIYFGSNNSMSLTDDEYKVMNKKHLLELANDGHLIFPHTHNHLFISDIIDKAMVDKELVKPKIIIEDITGEKLNVFAFPVGTEKQVSKYAYKNIRDHYEFCFTALSGLITKNTDHYKLYRTHLPANAPLSYINMIMRGVYDPYYRLKMNKLSQITDG